VQWDGELTAHTAQPWQYRNRAQWAVRNAKPRALGYYLPESNAIVPIDHCDLLSPTLADAFQRLQELARSGALPGEILEIEAFVDSADAKLALNVAFKDFTRPAAELVKTLRDALPSLHSLLLLNQKNNRFELSGPGFLLQEAAGYQFRVGHLSFFQVNRFLVDDLLKTVLSGAKGTLAYDLYAGVGFFTLPLTTVFERVVSVDSNLSATRNLRENAETAGRLIVSQYVQTEEFLKTASEQPDLVVLDPPRAGLGQAAAQKLADLGPTEITYLSCDPATLGRDLAVLLQSARKPAGATTAHRYAIESIDFFDLFPQTYHIETLVRLKRV